MLKKFVQNQKKNLLWSEIEIEIEDKSMGHPVFGDMCQS